jgi:predicted phosphodiesterase
MRRLLLSDIHSNMEALDVCMEKARHAGFDRIFCCGDVVGYGPQPNEAISTLREERAVTIRGNHDRVASGQDEPSDFNMHAARAALWTRDVLTATSREYLRNLPLGPLDIGDDGELVHGAVTGEDDYIMCAADAAESFALTGVRLTFFGHTHFQGAYTCDDRGEVNGVETSETGGAAALTLHRNLRYLINPGSVGQPRDGDARAAFAIWDSHQSVIEFYRVEYPFHVTQEKMRRLDLPTYLIERLSVGR